MPSLLAIKVEGSNISVFPIVNFFKYCGLNTYSMDACHSTHDYFPGKLYVFSDRDRNRLQNTNYSVALMYSANYEESAED